MFFSANVSMDVSAELGTILGMKIVSDPGTYLGVPIIWGHSKRQGLAYIKDRILAKIQGWKKRTLSQASNKVLLKALV